jgi:hypothetical protein
MSERLQDEHEELRSSTAKMLDLDVGNLSAAQSVRLDRCCVLRLLVSDLRGKQLRGEQINVREFVDASESLERMMGGNPAAAADPHDFSAAHAELAALLDGRMKALEHQMARDPDAARREFELKLARAIENHKPNEQGANSALIPDPGGGDECDGDVVHRPSPRAAAGSESVQVEPPEPAPPPMTDKQKMDAANSKPVPSNYLKGPDEPWRRHVGPDGVIAPWFFPHG